ncbi:hypothetical protein [Cellulomonas citrea]|uniref:hypothetical protein n=1 Tax=Cellulomonas citrea TaxID=1909423 RepID=UPI00135B9AC2|nr:hypothetical protein [Cellulomonas citrea]
MRFAELLRGLALLPPVLAIASLRNHSGWNVELDAGVSSLIGVRVRGVLVLLGALMFGTGSVLQTAHIGVGRWALLVLATVCAVAFGCYRPRAVEHPGPTRHAEAVRHLESRARRTWIGLFVGALVLAAWAAWPWSL